MSIVIDLRAMREPLLTEARAALEHFAEQRPETRVSAVGFVVDGFHGIATLYLDTPESADAQLSRWRGVFEGDPSIGRDAFGDYSLSCPDFAFCLLEHRLAGFPDLYEVEEDDATFLGLDGRRRKVDLADGDLRLHEAVAPLVEDVARALEPYAQLRRAFPFRALLQFADQEAWPLRRA